MHLSPPSPTCLRKRAVTHAIAWTCALWLSCTVLAQPVTAPAKPPTASAPATKPAAPPQSVAPYVPTPWPIVERIMALAEIGPNDYVVDLGSGDGRLVTTAVAKHGARGGFGVDIDSALVKLANENAAKAGLSKRVKFYERDLFRTDVGDASLVTLYLLPDMLDRVEVKLLAELKPGSRILSHDYALPNLKPEKVVEFDHPEKLAISGTTRTVLYLYRVPAR